MTTDIHGGCGQRGEAGALGKARGVEAVDRVADDRPQGERDRRPHVEVLDRHADEQRPEERTDNRSDAPQSKLPAGPVGAQRRRVDHGAGHVDAGLDAEHEESREERRDQHRGLRHQPGVADETDDGHGQHEHDGDGVELLAVEPSCQQQGTDGAAHLYGCPRQGPGGRRQLGRGKESRRPAHNEEEAHQVEREQEPQQRRDHRQAVAEQVGRVESRILVLVLDHEPRVRRDGDVGTDFRDHLLHVSALVLVQRHVLDRFGQAAERRQADHDRNDAADHEQDGPAVLRDEDGGDEARDGAANRNAADRDEGQGSAQVVRRRFDVDRDHVGDDSADADAGEQAQPEHLVEIRRIGGDQGEQAEQQVGAGQRYLAAGPVADPAEHARADEDSDEAGAEHRAERMRRDVPFADEVRCREGDRADVVAVDEDDEERPDEQADMERAQPAFVEQT